MFLNKKPLLALLLAISLLITACGTADVAENEPETFDKKEITEARYREYDKYSLPYKDETKAYAFLEEAAANATMNLVGTSASGSQTYVFTDQAFIDSVAKKIKACDSIMELGVVMNGTSIVFSILYQYGENETAFLTYSNHGYVTKTFANTQTQIVTLVESAGKDMYAMTRYSTKDSASSAPEGVQDLPLTPEESSLEPAA